MKISIIMPCYNSSKTILESIHSILNQTYENVELIVIDDGSSDNTLDIINSIGDKRIRIFKQSNMGPGKARNLGIKKATGDYILFCDSDDKLDLNIIENFLKIKEVYKFDIVLFRTQKVSNDGKILVDNKINSFTLNNNDRNNLINAIYDKFHEYNKFFGFDGVCGKFIKRDFLIKNNIFFPDYILRFEDAYFCKQIYKKCEKIRYEDILGYYYIQNPNSLCHKYNSNAIEMYIDALNVLSDNEQNENFYIKVLTTLTECEVLYFYNKNYKKTYFEYKKEFIKMLNKDVFLEALKKVDFKKIPLHYKVEVILLKYRFILFYTLLKKIYLNLKKSI